MSQEVYNLKESSFFFFCLTASYTADVVRRDSEARQTERKCTRKRDRSL